MLPYRESYTALKIPTHYPTTLDKIELGIALFTLAELGSRPDSPILKARMEYAISYFAKRAGECTPEDQNDYRMIGKILRLELAALSTKAVLSTNQDTSMQT
jgi:hypothetical protein